MSASSGAEDTSVQAADKEKQLADALDKFVQNALVLKSEKNDVRGYNKIIKQLSAKVGRAAMARWYTALSVNVSHISPRTMPELTSQIFAFDWTNESSPLPEFSHLLVNMVSANSDFLLPCLRVLVGSLIPEGVTAETSRDNIDDCIHNTITTILHLSPSASSQLFPVLIQCFPHKRHDVLVQTLYLKSLLRVSEYATELRDRILAAIVERLIQIDVEIKPELQDRQEDQVEVRLRKLSVDMDEDKADEEDDEPEQTAQTYDDQLLQEHRTKLKLEQSQLMVKIDSLMLLMFEYLELIKGAPETVSDDVFGSLLRVFDRCILTTHKSKHVQFLLFYFCSIRPKYTEVFLRRLLEKVFDSNTNPLCRHSCACYISSFVSRASFVRHATAIVCFEHLLNWAHSYVDCHKQYYGNEPVSPAEVGAHAVFYAVCQAVFDIFAERRDVFSERRRRESEGDEDAEASKFRFGHLLHSPLNPLRYCLDNVVRRFAEVTAETGLADCWVIMKRNAALAMCSDAEAYGSQLFEFFPFSSYQLEYSSSFITPLLYSGRAASASTVSTPHSSSCESDADADDDTSL